jgi:hypothetical protein
MKNLNYLVQQRLHHVRQIKASIKNIMCRCDIWKGEKTRNPKQVEKKMTLVTMNIIDNNVPVTSSQA